MRLSAREATALFAPRRLTLARQLHAITRAELSRRAGVSAAAVSQYERGQTRPRAGTLAQLALVLQVPIEFFAEPRISTEPPTVAASFFRSLRRTTQRDRERATALAGILGDLVAAIEDRVVLPTFDVPKGLALDPDADAEGAEAAAAQVRAAWGIQDGPVEHVVRAMERHGIAIARLPVLTGDVDAFSWTEGPRPLVLLGSDKGVYERSRLDAAHELAHAVLHAADPEPANRPMENQANRFAASFLVPADEFRDEWHQGRIDWSHLQRLRQRWGVSMGALLYRAKDLGLVEPEQYESAMRYMSRTGWRTQEPGPHRPPEIPSLIAEALRLLAASGVSIEVLAADAGLPPDVAERLGIEEPATTLRVAI